VIRTPFTELLGIDHPVVSAGMGAGTSDGDLSGRVSEAGGLGVIGASWLDGADVRGMVERAREITAKPIGVNLLLFGNEELLDDVLEMKPAVLSTAWAREDQDLSAMFARAHDKGIRVMHMVTTRAGAVRAADAGADVIVAQGNEGGGHVGEIGTAVIVPQVVRAVEPVPVLAAGGFAEGAGLAAALALGAAGVLLGTRFVASEECPVPPEAKAAIVESDGTDTVVTTVPDTFSGNDWPGAWARVLRTRFIEEWLGREPELRRRREEVRARLKAARDEGDADYRIVWSGQSAALIDAVLPAGEIVQTIVAEAEDILQTSLPALVSP
jgi:NAD(P)H-dependent flavin oxidoreductase YrpB (nitropropane dioxygenase family)